jgi:hypothetical protein
MGPSRSSVAQRALLHCARPGQVQCGLHLGSDRHGQLVERHGQPPARHLLSSQLVMAPSNVLDKGMAANEHPGGTVLLEAAHRPWPRLQPVMVGLDPVVGVRPSQRVLPWACRWPAEGTGGLFGVAPCVAKRIGSDGLPTPRSTACALASTSREGRGGRPGGRGRGGLVGELGVDVHRVIIDREAPERGVADQDLVPHLRVALEHLGVALGLDQAHWALSTRRPADPSSS